MTAKLDKAKNKVAVYRTFDKSGDEVNEIREASKAQWQRANDAEQHVRRLEDELAPWLYIMR